MSELHASGAQTAVAYVKETTPGQVPANPNLTYARIGEGLKFDLKRDTFASKEKRPDRQVSDVRYGNKQPTAQLPFEFSFGSFDDFLQSHMGRAWAADILKAGNVVEAYSLELQNADIYAYELMTGCIFNQFSLSIKPNQAVTGSFGVVARKSIIAESTNQNIAVDATTKTFTRLAGSFITDGFAVGLPVHPAGFTSAGNNGHFVITALTATVMTCADAVGLVDEAGAVGRNIFMDTVDQTPTAASATPALDSFTGQILENGSVIGYVTGLDFTRTNNNSADFSLFNDSPSQVNAGTIETKGTLTAFFVNQALRKKFINGTPSSIQFQLGDGVSNTYVFDMPKIMYTGNDRNYGSGSIIESAPFQAVVDSVLVTDLQITRIP